MNIVYLRECKEHVPEMAALFHAQWSNYHKGRTLDDVARLLSGRADNVDHLDLTVVALVGDTWAGSASLKEFDMESIRDLAPWLSSVYVKEEFRTQGIARALIQTVLLKARDLKFDIVYLCTIDAEPYYAGLGWKRHRLATENDLEFVIMSYAL